LNGVTAPIHLNPYGHDLSWLDAYQGKTGSDRIRFGYIGQIVPAKGLHLALEALRKLPPSVSEMCSLTVYGNVDRMPSYAWRIRELGSGISNVSFQGIYPHAESARVFSEIDVLLVPSIWYDFPLIIDEAHATNTPVIATNLGGMAEVVVHEKNGLLFERADVNHLTEQLQRVIVEPGLIGKLQGGISRIKTIQQEVIELFDIYRSLIVCLFLVFALHDRTMMG
jgi:glycosyltransferase involved in cell wall biosynthesis